MVDCVEQTVGAIAYIESGQGNNAGLPEVYVQNQAGTYLTSVQAASRGGIAAAETNAFPARADSNFGNVNLLYRPGINTWPMVIMTYLYVRNDLNYITDPLEQAYLVAFLQAMQMEEYVGVCRDQYGFVLPGPEASAITKAGIDNLVENVKNSAFWGNQTYTPFTFETGIDPITGMGDYVISVNRQTISEVEIDDLLTRLSDLETTVSTLQQQLSDAADTATAVTQANADLSAYTYAKQSQLNAALVLASLAFSMCIVFFFYSTATWMSKL